MSDMWFLLGVILAFAATIEFIWRVVAGKSFWAALKKWLVKLFDVLSGI